VAFAKLVLKEGDPASGGSSSKGGKGRGVKKGVEFLRLYSD